MRQRTLLRSNKGVFTSSLTLLYFPLYDERVAQTICRISPLGDVCVWRIGKWLWAITSIRDTQRQAQASRKLISKRDSYVSGLGYLVARTHLTGRRQDT